MTQEERRVFLIRELLRESGAEMELPQDEGGQKRLLRSLMNVRPPKQAVSDFLQIQDEYLQMETAGKGITGLSGLDPAGKGIYLWQGDITTLACDAIVNAANGGMLGCFYPCHGCIDNAIHTFSGIQLRLACAEQMKKQGHDEPPGKAKITSGFNLPCKYVIHTVGPIVHGKVRRRDEELLASCYQSCMELAEGHGLESVAFCCISTGEFHFPHDRAAQIAVRTVREYMERTRKEMKIIFNVYKDIDYQIYQKLL